MTHRQSISLGQIYKLVMTHAWFQEVFQPHQCRFNDLLTEFQGEIQFFLVWYVP